MSASTPGPARGRTRRHPNPEFTRPTPTPELQELFNNMRDTEEDLDIDDRLRLRNDPSLDPSRKNGSLWPPPASHNPSTSRNLPHATSAPVNLAMSDGIHDIEHPAASGRRPGGRHGPLDNYTKARAAFMRRIGVCQQCRKRKVKCHHRDLTLFEGAYLEAKRSSSSQEAIPPQSRQAQTITDSMPLMTNRGGSIGTQTLGTDLLGVEENPASLPVDHVGGVEDLNRHLAQTTSPTRPSSLRHPQSSLAKSPNSLPATASSYFTTPGDGHMPPFLSSPQESYLPIGRDVANEHEAWECQGGTSEGTRSSSVYSVDTGDACLQVFGGLPELQAHFRIAHAQFRETYPPFMFKCTRCHFLNDICMVMCPHCVCPEPAWERWYYGLVASGASASSASFLLVPTPQLGGWPRSAGWRQTRNQGQGNGSSSSGYFSGGGFGNGNCKQYTTAPAADSVWRMPALRYFFYSLCLFLAAVAVWGSCGTPTCMFGRMKALASEALDAVWQHLLGSSLLCFVAGIMAVWLFRLGGLRLLQWSAGERADGRCGVGFFRELKVDVELADSGSNRDFTSAMNMLSMS